MRFFFSISYVFLLLLPSLLMGQKPMSPRIANYQMDIKLNVEEKTLSGQTILNWRNPGSTEVAELQFHLYYNAFKNSESTFFKESDGIPDFFKETLINECGWSWSEIEKIRDQYGHDLSEGMEYIQPDDDNEEDQTVLRVLLAQPVLPGDSIEIAFEWKARIPKSMIRTGYNMDYYFFAQWFPKVGVYETAGTRFAKVDQWNCHQYHANGEYYSDFGVYEVNLNVPKGYVVGASGTLTKKEESDEREIWSFLAEDVIDFTWTTSPDFVVQETTWNDVEISLLTYPGHEHFAPRYFKTIKNAFEYLDEHVGKYPYKTLTIVDPPIHGLFTGGMEYPTLISSISVCFIPAGLKGTETLVTHEFIHQYFMQMVATHEQEEPWMDEGFTTYYEGRILDHYEGQHTSLADFLGVTIGNSEYNRAEFFGMKNPKIADQTYRSRDYVHGGYGPIAYNKTAIWMRTLEGLIGRKSFDEIMQTYFERWKFKHPGRQDFIDVVNEVVTNNHGAMFGEDMNWFFKQVVEGSDICDYSIASISNEKIAPKLGFVKNTNDCVRIVEGKESDQVLIRSRVVLNRLGEIILPVDIKINFENGESEWAYWEGKERSFEFSYIGPTKVISAEIDPQRKIHLDKNMLNNSLTTKSQNRGITKYWLQFMGTMQHFMEGLSIFI